MMFEDHTNAGIPEKSLSGIGISPVSPTSAFRHQGQSGITGKGLVRHCSAMLVYKNVHICMGSWDLPFTKCVL
jgi:hypothetical protein